MNALQKIILYSTAVGVVGGVATGSEINRKEINEFLKDQAGTSQTWVAKSNGGFYNFLVVSKNENSFGRPHAQATETSTDVANICNTVYQGLPLEVQVKKSKGILKDYMIREMGIAVEDSLIQPAFSPDSSKIARWNFNGNADEYLERLKLGEDSVIGSDGKIRIFNDEYGIEKIKKYIMMTLFHSTKFKPFKRKNPINHSLQFPVEDIVSWYERLRDIPKDKSQELLNGLDSIEDGLNDIEEGIEKLGRAAHPKIIKVPGKPDTVEVQVPYEVREPIEFGLFGNYSNNDGFVVGVSFPLVVLPLRANFGVGLPIERTESLDPQYSSTKFLSGNTAYHSETGRTNDNLVDLTVSYPIDLGKGLELEIGAGASIFRRNLYTTTMDKIVSPEGYIIDQDVDHNASDKINSKLRTFVGAKYNVSKKVNFGINAGFRGNNFVGGASVGFKIPYKGKK